MRTAIISDIHSNLEALLSCLESVEKNRADRVVCLGDIVGYGADPGECISRVRAVGEEVVAGNHDHGSVGGCDISLFNEYARAAIQWTMDRISGEEADYLKSLPMLRTVDGQTLVHASPRRPEEWEYLLTLEQVRRQFGSFDSPACFVGHSHVPGAFESDGRLVTQIDHHFVRLVPGRKYIFNVGSVGQPRDGDPRSSYALYDQELETVSIIRVSYDVASAQEKIREAGLPSLLADRLSVGR